MSDFVQKLESLNPQQVAKVMRLIDKLAAKNGGEVVVKPKAKPAKQKQQSRQEEPAGEIYRPKDNKSKNKKPNKGPKLAEPAPLFIGKRQNLFEDTEEAKPNSGIIGEEEAQDENYSKINDKAKKPMPRPANNRTTKIDIKCSECKEEFTVPTKLLIKSEGKFKYTCNDCLVGKGRRNA